MRHGYTSTNERERRKRITEHGYQKVEIYLKRERERERKLVCKEGTPFSSVQKVLSFKEMDKGGKLGMGKTSSFVP